MDILIITGGSKGIGKAIAEKYNSENHVVYSLSRTTVAFNTKDIKQFSVDLSSLTETKNILPTLFNTINLKKVASITLINNAGRLGKISSLENLESEDISKTIQLNTTTPLILSSIFIKLTEQFKCKKQIISISSGAAINPYEGWSIYCTSKAAIDMMTKAIACEQDSLNNGVKATAIYPGVVDTNMQTQIRSTNESDFKNLQRFIDLKENNELYTPEFVAQNIFKIDTKNLLKNGDIIDIRNF